MKQHPRRKRARERQTEKAQTPRSAQRFAAKVRDDESIEMTYRSKPTRQYVRIKKGDAAHWSKLSPVPFSFRPLFFPKRTAFGDLLVKLIESCTKQISLAGQAIFKLFYRAYLPPFLVRFEPPLEQGNLSKSRTRLPIL